MDDKALIPKIAFAKFRDSTIHKSSKVTIKLIMAQICAIEAIADPNLLLCSLNKDPKHKEIKKSTANATAFINIGLIAMAHKQITELGNPEVGSKLFAKMNIVTERAAHINGPRISGTKMAVKRGRN